MSNIQPTEPCPQCHGTKHVTAWLLGIPTQFECPACCGMGEDPFVAAARDQARRKIQPTGGQPAPEAVEQAHAETFGNILPSEWKAILEIDWERDRRLFEVLVVPGVNASKVFQVAWEAGFKAALELRNHD